MRTDLGRWESERLAREGLGRTAGQYQDLCKVVVYELETGQHG